MNTRASSKTIRDFNLELQQQKLVALSTSETKLIESLRIKMKHRGTSDGKIS